jgi:hypothetical protein
MPNFLHTMLAAANIQARPVLGDTFDYGTQTGLIWFLSAADEVTAFQAGGTLDQIDHVAVAAVDQFALDNLPVVNALITLNGSQIFEIRSMKTDASAYLLGLKKISV